MYEYPGPNHQRPEAPALPPSSWNDCSGGKQLPTSATLRLPFMERENSWPAPEIPALPALAPDMRVQKPSWMFQPQEITCRKEPRPQTYGSGAATKPSLAVSTTPDEDPDTVQHRQI